MSDNDTGSATAGNAATSTFTERELQMLGWAMQSLKTGPPEIDYVKLAGFAGMSNPRSAGNAWAKIKAKLILPNADGTTPAPTPKKAGGRKKANPAPADDGEEGEAPETPKKTPRKRAAKKQDVDGGDASPKKRGRPTKNKSPKADSVEVEDSNAVDTIKTEEVFDDNVEDEV